MHRKSESEAKSVPFAFLHSRVSPNAPSSADYNKVNALLTMPIAAASLGPIDAGDMAYYVNVVTAKVAEMTPRLVELGLKAKPKS
jgi:hypothetical protein